LQHLQLLESCASFARCERTRPCLYYTLPFWLLLVLRRRWLLRHSWGFASLIFVDSTGRSSTQQHPYPLMKRNNNQRLHVVELKAIVILAIWHVDV
jgi:hypothetical protein